MRLHMTEKKYVCCTDRSIINFFCKVHRVINSCYKKINARCNSQSFVLSVYLISPCIQVNHPMLLKNIRFHQSTILAVSSSKLLTTNYHIVFDVHKSMRGRARNESVVSKPTTLSRKELLRFCVITHFVII